MSEYNGEGPSDDGRWDLRIMRLLFFGSGDFAVPSLEGLCNGRHEVAAVVTQPDRPRGRGRQPAPTPVKHWASSRGLDVLSVDDVNAPEIVDRLLARRAAVGVVVAFGQKIREALLGGLSGGLINLHASLLPRHRGAAPINCAILAGDTVTGVTVFRLTDRMDAGPVLTQVDTPIGPLETAEELHDRLALLGPEALAAALASLEATPPSPGRAQDENHATRAPKLSKNDGVLDFDQPAERLARRIRGLWSWPGARCRFRSADGGRDEIVTLARAEAVADEGEGIPGTLGSDLTVVTASGALRILELKPAGGKKMTWAAYVNGRHVRPGDRFAPVEPAT